MLAATHSEAGKTTITLGLLAALAERGLDVQPFKCGPDFIDPTLHQVVSGQVSRNLDLRMCGPDFVTACFRQYAALADVAVVEGVMGLFDGGAASSAALAKTLRLPIVLIVDSRSCAESIAAIVKGFESLDPELNLAGVILNRVGSPRHLDLLHRAIDEHCRTPVLGALPRDTDFAIPERHLGLVMGEEMPLNDEQLARLARTINQGLNLEKLLAACNIKGPKAGPATPEVTPARPSASSLARIAIARDQAFCFYYQDNLDLLVEQGAELVPFSPLRDLKLPDNIDGIYLGGGYPELHARELAANETMLTAIREWARQDKPLYDECGGFMYLTRGITDQQDTFWPLAAVFPTTARMKRRLARLGYREARITGPCFWGESGQMYGHEFHYSEIKEMPSEIRRVYTLQDGSQEGYQIHNTLAGYLHLHFGKTPAAVRNFIEFCQTGGG